MYGQMVQMIVQLKQKGKPIFLGYIYGVFMWVCCFIYSVIQYTVDILRVTQKETARYVLCVPVV